MHLAINNNHLWKWFDGLVWLNGHHHHHDHSASYKQSIKYLEAISSTLIQKLEKTSHFKNKVPVILILFPTLCRFCKVHGISLQTRSSYSICVNFTNNHQLEGVFVSLTFPSQPVAPTNIFYLITDRHCAPCVL